MTLFPSVEDVHNRINNLIEKKDDQHWFFRTPINPVNKIKINEIRLIYRHWVYYMEHGKPIDKDNTYIQTCNESQCVAPNHHLTILKSHQTRKDEWTFNEWELIRRQLKNHIVINKDSDCWIWQGQSTQDGYGKFGDRPAHSWSLMAFKLLYYFKGSVSEQVRHSCHVRLCINPGHLEMGTFKENIEDSVRDRRTILNHRKTKLNEEQVRSVKQYMKDNPDASKTDVAKTFELHRSFIYAIANGHSWVHIGATTKEDDINKRITNRNTKPVQSIKNLDDSRLQNEFFLLMLVTRLKELYNPPIILTEEEKLTLEGDHLVINREMKNGEKMSYIIISGYRLLASHLSWIVANKKLIPPNLIIRHKCKVKGCLTATHLELGTMLDNAQDKIRDGTSLKGELCPTSKLTEKDVLNILKRKRDDPTFKTVQVSKEYKVSHSAISQIISGRNWGHLKQKMISEEQKRQKIEIPS